jgi:uncharacterized protein (DUF302 family)
MINYGFTKTVDHGFENALDRVTEELKKEGFGVISRVDMHEKFKEKLGIDYKRYVILGACNPPLALKVVEEEATMGLMLPCNVIVYENDGKTEIAVIKPSVAMEMVDNDNLRDIALQVEEKLHRVIDAV